MKPWSQSILLETAASSSSSSAISAALQHHSHCGNLGPWSILLWLLGLVRRRTCSVLRPLSFSSSSLVKSWRGRGEEVESHHSSPVRWRRCLTLGESPKKGISLQSGLPGSRATRSPGIARELLREFPGGKEAGEPKEGKDAFPQLFHSSWKCGISLGKPTPPLADMHVPQDPDQASDCSKWTPTSVLLWHDSKVP